jgi:hypothetical protein
MVVAMEGSLELVEDWFPVYVLCAEAQFSKACLWEPLGGVGVVAVGKAMSVDNGLVGSSEVEPTCIEVGVRLVSPEACVLHRVVHLELVGRDDELDFPESREAELNEVWVVQ